MNNLEKELQARNVQRVELVAAYVRVSTQEQKLHGLSLDAQKMKLTEYAENNNMKIVEWYIDEGVSGRKLIRNRPELQRMIQDAEKGKFSRCIFIKLDRFFRSVAEYHEAMKRMSPVLWTATEEEYDLTTANGRMLVNMKLTIAEMEADQTGERIKIVNEYKVQTGQPLVGSSSQPFGFKNAIDPATGRKKVIKDPEYKEVVEDLLAYLFKHQSKRRAVSYLHSKHHISLPYHSISSLVENTMLCGEYRGNPNYCEAYLTREEFDRLQEITKRNVKLNTENRDYIFTGLLKCPHCGCRLAGGTQVNNVRGRVYRYKRYRCPNFRLNNRCDFNKSLSENVLERMLLKDIEKFFKDAKIKSVEVTDAEAVQVEGTSIDEIHDQIDRLNYSWQTGKVRTVEKYEKDYAELMEKLEKAEAEQTKVVVKDFSKIEAILEDGWKAIYENLDDAYKRAFWRSFIKSIELHWTTEEKKITRVNF
jgi:DNA invertase Pin-like site-specific DNA recombinase